MTKGIPGRGAFRAARLRVLPLAALLLAASCQWGIRGAGEGDLDGSATDARDTAQGDHRADAPDARPDVPTDREATDPAGEEEARCGSPADCDDLEPCNGAETCGAGGACAAGTPLAEGTLCTTAAVATGRCRGGACVATDCGDGETDAGEECDDGNSAPDDGCGNDCRYSCHEAADCDDASVCTTDTCVDGGGGKLCSRAFNSEACDDGLFCTRTDACDGAGTCAGSGAACDDGLDCTTDSCDDAADACAHGVVAGSCAVGGACHAHHAADPANDCRWCDAEAAPEAWSDKPSTETCAGDGLACTTDACNGSGACVSTPSDSLCETGGLCRPACAPAPTGCVRPPTSLVLDCESPVTLPNSSRCLIDVGGLAGQASCLSCAAEAGVIVLDYADFGEDTGSCSADGWSLVSTTSCSNSVTSCTPSGEARACCATFSAICVHAGDRYHLRTDQNTNCPGRLEEWRLTKAFNTTGVTNLSLCFEVADSYATPAEGLLVYASDGAHNDRVYCLNGEPQEGVGGVFYPYCVDLPSWAANNANLRLTFVAHSEDPGRQLWLDTVSLRGWTPSCAPTTRTVFTESFSGCANPIPNGWNGWQVGGTPNCPGTWGCEGASAQAARESWTLERQVSTEELDGNVTLCFSLGDAGAGYTSGSFTAEFNTQRGGGWRTAFRQTGNLGPDSTCRQVCVKLSDIDPNARRNPLLRIRFSVNAPDVAMTSTLDDITLSGAVFCPGAGLVTLGAIAQTADNDYAFDATDAAASRLTADLSCSWDTPPTPVTGWDTVSYIP